MEGQKVEEKQDWWIMNHFIHGRVKLMRICFTYWRLDDGKAYGIIHKSIDVKFYGIIDEC